MCRKLIFLVFVVSILTAITTVQAEVFSDDFETTHDYLTDGIVGTGWDGFIGLGDNETVDVLNASIDREGQLYIESNGSYWEGQFSPMGPLLYKLVQGDFVATVLVTDFAGEDGNEVYHNDSFIMARVPDLDSAGPGEDFECVHYFPTWVGNMGRTYDDGIESEWGGTDDDFACATYIQLERTGNTFYHRYSFDGQTWTQLTGSPVVRDDMDGLPLQVGLGNSLYSGNTGYVAFDNFTLEGPTVLVAAKAYLPNPPDGATDVPVSTDLSWMPGIVVDKHDIYFGTDVNDVNEAGRDDGRGVLVKENHEETAFDADIDYNTTYYWRVDEVNELNPDSPWKGDVWSFTSGDFIVVEDFEDYNDFPPNEIFMTWVDGYGVPTNGSVSGYPAPDFVGGEHYMEDSIVHSGDWSMPLFYDNSAGISEVTRTFDSSQNWTVDDVIALTLFYYGEAGNAIEPMYVVVNGSAVITNDDQRAVLANEWSRWDVLLQDIADQGVDLTRINSMSIGFGNKTNPVAGGEGHVFFDDIRLYRSLPEDTGPGLESVDPGTANLEVYYDFENDIQDGSGNGRHGTAYNGAFYGSGPTGYGTAINLDGLNDFVELPIGQLISTLSDCTIATWVNWSGQGDAWQRIFDFGNPPATADEGPTTYMFLTSDAGGGTLRFAITINGGGDEDQTNGAGDFPSGWHHVAVAIDSANMSHTLYVDGKVVGQNTAARNIPRDLGQTTQNWLGRSQYAADSYFEGSYDEFRIYDRVLSEAEVLYLTGR